MNTEYGRVIFFPVKWFPPYRMIDALYRIQAEMRNFHFQVEKESKDLYEITLRKQQMVNHLRSKMHIVQGSYLQISHQSECEHDPDA